MLNRFVFFLVLLIPLSVLAADKVFTWTGEDGVVHFGDRPPMESDAKEIAIQGKKKAALSVTDEQLTGQWFGTSDRGGEVKITLNANGSIAYIQTRADQSVYNYQGIWTLESTTLSIITEFSQTAQANSDFKRSVEPLQIEYNITRFEADSMSMIKEGEVFTVSKITRAL